MQRMQLYLVFHSVCEKLFYYRYISVNVCGFYVVNFRMRMSYSFVQLLKIKKFFVETKGLNDCLLYESANVIE